MTPHGFSPEQVVVATIRDFHSLDESDVVREAGRAGGGLLGASHWALVEMATETIAGTPAGASADNTAGQGWEGSVSVRDASSPEMVRRQLDGVVDAASPVRRCIEDTAAVSAEFHPANGWYDAHGRASLNAGVHHEYAFPLGDIGGSTAAFVWSRTHELPASGEVRDIVEVLVAATGMRLGLGRSLRAATTLVAQLDAALSSRVLIEQAKGLVAGRDGVDLSAAFDGLRGAARSSGRRLLDVAAEVVARRSEPSQPGTVPPAGAEPPAGGVSQPGTIARRTGRSQPG